MSTNKINQANINANQQLNNLNKSKVENEDAAKASKTNISTGAERSSTERVDISENATKLSKLRQIMEAGEAALKEEPPVREEKIIEVKEKISSGYYNSAEVKDELASKLSDLIVRMDKVIK